MIKKLIIITIVILVLLVFTFVSGQSGNVVVGGNKQRGVILNPIVPTANGSGGGSGGGGGNLTNDTVIQLINQYAWRLDASNDDDISSDWNMHSFNFTGLNGLIFNGTLYQIIYTDNVANLNIKALGVTIESDLPRLGTGRNTAVSLEFDVEGGNDGTIVFHNASSSIFNFSNFETNEYWFFEDSINVSRDINATLVYAQNLCYANGTNSSGGICGNGTQGIAVETDPRWSANLTVINNTNCPAGNYSFGLLGNGTWRCRSDVDTGITVETDPIWTSNLTVMNATECPAGNYSYGILGNATWKCRSDLSGSGATFDNTNIAYLNNSQTFTLANNFSANTIFKGNVTIDNNLTVRNFSAFMNNMMLLAGRQLQLGGTGTYLTADGVTGVLAGTIIELNGTVLSLGTRLTTGVALNFLSSGGSNGIITYNNASNRNTFDFTRTGGALVPLIFATWFPSTTVNNINLTFGGAGNSIFQANVNHSVFTGMVNITRNLNVTGNTTTSYIISNGSRLTDVCFANGTNCQNTSSGGGGNGTEIPSQNNASIFFSITTEANSTSASTQFGFFNNASYSGGIRYTNNTNASGASLTITSGNITFTKRGKIFFDLSLLFEIDGNDFTVSIQKNSAKIYNHNAFLPTLDSVCDNEGNIDIPLILDVEVGDNISITGTQGSNTCLDGGMQSLNGTMLNIFQIA